MTLSLFHRMDYDDWLAPLGSQWSICDNIREHLRELRCVLGTKGPLLPMMSPEEQSAFVSLPDLITVFRGGSASHLRGVSWSLDPQVARRFPSLDRYRVPDPVLVTAVTRKQDVLAFIFDREEQEIITFRAKRKSVEPLG
jgi:hypothetical protein